MKQDLKTDNRATAVEHMRFLLELMQQVPHNELLSRSILRVYGDYRAQGGIADGLHEPLQAALIATRAAAQKEVTGQDLPAAAFLPTADYPRLLEDAQEPQLAAHWAWQNLVDVLEQRFFEGHGVSAVPSEAEHFLREQGLDPAAAQNTTEREEILARLRAFNSCYDAAQPVHGGPERPKAREMTAELYRQWMHKVAGGRQAA